MFRNKVLDALVEKYLNPILEFNGIALDYGSGYGLLRNIGTGGPNNVSFLMNEYNDNKLLTFIRTEEQFLKYKLNKETLEYFNPFMKYKNALYLLLLSIPTFYVKICKCSENYDDSDIIDLILNDELTITQEQLLESINVKQYPMDLETKKYKFEVSMKRDDGELEVYDFEDEDKSVAIIILLLQVISSIDVVPPIVAINAENWDNICIELKEDLERYVKERELNRKDLGKIKEEESVDNINYSSDEDVLCGCEIEIEDDKCVSETDGVINVSKYMNDTFKIQSKDSDDDYSGITFN